MSARRPYMRPMTGWWRRDPYYMRYMAREVTAIFVAAYTVVLLVGVLRLAQGEAAYNAWLAALATPWSVLFHMLMLAVFVYHTWSWFSIMPKTMPILFVGGKRVQPATITNTGLALAAAVCLGFFFFVLWVSP